MRKDIISHPRGGPKILVHQRKYNLTHKHAPKCNKIQKPKDHRIYLKFILCFIGIILNWLWIRRRLLR